MGEPDEVIGSSETAETELKPKVPTPDARAAGVPAPGAPEVVRVAVESMPRVEVRVEGVVPPVRDTSDAWLTGAKGRRASERSATGGPMGALPGAVKALPPLWLAPLLRDAQRCLALIGRGLRDITTASIKLAWLPVRIAFFAMRKLRPLKA